MKKQILSSVAGATALAALGASAPSIASPPAASAPPVVRTEAGSLRGEAMGDYRRFRGIPYAAPPVGPLRWRAPQPAAAWTGVRDATRPAAACLQPPGGTAAADLSEDCLYLDVVAPRDAGPRRLRPVMVWVHGGGFSTGSATDYDARRLAVEGDVVVVTINYRLGAFGFFGYPGLEDSGAYGLLDQQAALKWVRRNVKAFGGDPRNVTLFGESAGAMSTCAQLVAPGAKGLFDKAIMQSGTCLQRWAKSMIWPGAESFEQFVPVAQVTAAGAAAAAKLNCEGPDAVACLRAAPAEAVMAAFPQARPAYGGRVLPERPSDAFLAGRFHHVPLIWGSTRDEWRSSAGIFAKSKPLTPALYRQYLHDAFGDAASEIEAVYPPQGEEAAYAWAAVSTDSAWWRPTLVSARAASRWTEVHLYTFDDREAPNPAYPVASTFDLGAAHATELAYLFDLPGVTPLRPDQAALAKTMRRCWTNFARTGKPSGKGLPPWPAVSGADETQALSLAPGEGALQMVDVAQRYHFDLWERVAGHRR